MRWLIDRTPTLRAAFFPPLPPMLRWWRLGVWIYIGFCLLWVLALEPFANRYADAPLLRGLCAWAIPVATVFFLGMCVCWGFVAWRVKRAYRAADGRLCAACLHPMTGLEQQALCPECGRAYDAQADAALWQNAGMELRPPDNPKP